MQNILKTDGASKGNPGPAGVGVVLEFEQANNRVKKKYSKSIGVKTNNEAEYQALIYGLERAKQFKIKNLICYSDSQLMVRQLNGEYKLKNAKVIEKFIKIWNLKIGFANLEFKYIPREQNKEADELAKRGSLG